MKTLICQQCSGTMKKTSKGRGNIMGILCALLVFGIGVALIVTIPCFGWVLGAILCVYALFMGGKKEKMWKCLDCGAIVPRA